MSLLLLLFLVPMLMLVLALVLVLVLVPTMMLALELAMTQRTLRSSKHGTGSRTHHRIIIKSLLKFQSARTGSIRCSS